MICSGMGNVVYNDEVTVKYRRLQKNATAEGQNALKVLLWRIDHLVSDNQMKDIRIQQQEYKKMFYNKLSDENKNVLDIFVQDKYNFFNAVKKLFWCHKIRRKTIDDLMVRILFIFGIL